MATPENWHILDGKSRTKIHQHTKRDVHLEIVHDFNKKFSTEVGENQIKNKIDTIYRTFINEQIFYLSTGNGDSFGTPELDNIMLDRCHFFFILYEVGNQTEDSITVRNGQSYQSSSTRRANADAVTSQTSTDDSDLESDTSSSEDDSGEEEEQGESSKQKRRSTSASTSTLKKSRQRQPSKGEGSVHPDMRALMKYVRQVTKREVRKVLIEDWKVELEKEKHLHYTKERSIELREREMRLREWDLQLREREKRLSGNGEADGEVSHTWHIQW